MLVHYALAVLQQPAMNTKALRERYHTLARKHHPDKGGARGQFELVGQAYRCLLPLAVTHVHAHANPTAPAEPCSESDDY